MEHGIRFADLVLDADSLHTPVGAMRLVDITRAEFVRNLSKGTPSESTRETSAPAVAGGAVLGGVLLGPAGALAGGLLGSTVKEDVEGFPTYHTESVKIVFETSSDTYSMDISREQETEANNFVKSVQKAVKHAR